MKQIDPELLPPDPQPTYQPPAVATHSHLPSPISNLPPPAPELNLQVIADRILTGELTSEKLGMIKDLLAMNAERKFATAFVTLQGEIPKVMATRAVPNNDGTVRYNFAPYEEIMATVSPLLSKHGFTITFSTEYDGPRIVKLCELQHESGHKKVNKFAVRIGSGPPKANESQADGAAGTYAKRQALCDCLNIVIEHDSDARAESAEPITAAQAEELERRVALIDGSNHAKFLQFAGGAARYADIPASEYPRLDEFLQSKERNKKTNQPTK